MGSDTCGSIRIPAAYQNLFGFRTTRGLASRSGVVPLSDTPDVAGPLARSVTDLAIMLDATVGEDPADAVTKGAGAHVPKSYADALQPGALKGARIGVLRSLFAVQPADPEGKDVYDKAIAAMRGAGAELVEVAIPGLDALLADFSTGPFEFAEDLQRYLAGHPGAPVKSLADIVGRGLHHDQLDTRLRDGLGKQDRQSPGYQVVLAKRTLVRAAADALFERERLDAVIYPTSLGRPPVIGAENIASNCPLSVVSGLPALAIPAGFTPRGLPVGLELLGPAFAEQKLLGLAYGWEQLAKPRQPPFSTPPLVAGKPPVPVQAGPRSACDMNQRRRGCMPMWRPAAPARMHRWRRRCTAATPAGRGLGLGSGRGRFWRRCCCAASGRAAPMWCLMHWRAPICRLGGYMWCFIRPLRRWGQGRPSWFSRRCRLNRAALT